MAQWPAGTMSKVVAEWTEAWGVSLEPLALQGDLLYSEQID